MNFPYVIVVSDGVVIRTLHRPAFTPADAATIEAIISRAIDPDERAPAPAPPSPKPAPHAEAMMTQGEIARTQGFSGDECFRCHNFTMKRVGTCLTCTTCGETTGCS